MNDQDKEEDSYCAPSQPSYYGQWPYTYQTTYYDEPNQPNTKKEKFRTRQIKPSKTPLIIILILFILFAIITTFCFSSHIITQTTTAPVTLTQSQFAQGKTLDIQQDQEINYEINKTPAILKLSTVDENSKQVTLDINGEELSLNQGQEVDLDLDKNKEYDSKLKLLVVYENRAVIRLQELKTQNTLLQSNKTAQPQIVDNEKIPQKQTKPQQDKSTNQRPKNNPPPAPQTQHQSIDDQTPINPQSKTSPTKPCQENWSCTSWSTCTNGQQTRTCTDLNDCNTQGNKPTQSQSCQEALQPSQDQCSTDSNCDDNNPSTKDSCIGTPKQCSHIQITACISNDGYCPKNCDSSTDNDCPPPTQPNSPPVDCQVSPWSDWSQCSAQCNGGTQTRTRTIIIQPANSGAPCPVLTESQSCNTQSCSTSTTHTINVVGLAFAPNTLTINAGDTVKWTNLRDKGHNVVQTPNSNSCEAQPAGFTSGEAGSKDIWERTFETPGTYYYMCDPHCGAGMKGIVIVN